MEFAVAGARVEGQQVGHLGIRGEVHGAGKVVGVFEKMSAGSGGDFFERHPEEGLAQETGSRGEAARADGVDDDVPADTAVDELFHLRLIGANEEAGGVHDQDAGPVNFGQLLGGEAEGGNRVERLRLGLFPRGAGCRLGDTESR